MVFMENKNEHFAKGFLAKLDGKISDDDLGIVLKELQLYVDDYDINKKCFELATHDQLLPEVYKAYMVAKKVEGLSPDSLKSYAFHLTEFFRIVNKPVEKITTNDIRRYIYMVQTEKNVSNRTLDNKRLVLNAFFSWCKIENYIDDNPCARIKPIKFKEEKRKPLTDMEMEQLRFACKTPRERALIELFYSTGCRVSEMANLNIDDIDFDKKEITVFGKGSKYRTVYLNAKAEFYVKKYLDTRTDDCEVLIASCKKPIRRLRKESIELIVKNIGKRSEIKRRVYPHLIRHTTATDALSRGMPVEEVKDLLGHVKMDTTLIYAEVAKENVKNHHKKFVL